MSELEEAAKQYSCGLRELDKKNVYDNIDVDSCRMVGFKAGAKWQAKQSLWISVEEQEPLTNEPILVMLEGKPVIMILCGWDNRLGYHPDVTHWMPIPKFEE